jgi:hypothetical protein
MLHIWPQLPISVSTRGDKLWGVKNVIAALEHTDRICTININNISRSQLERVLAAMRRPFPALKYLHLRSEDETAPIDPASFLGGSASLLHLLYLQLDGISFPELPKRLLSAAHLVVLRLSRIPDSGYISPEAIATHLSMLTKLECLWVGFESPQSRPDRHPPPQIRIFPVLTHLRFEGVSEYLEDLVAQIDAPLLDDLKITLFHRLTFDTSQLTQFISRTSKLKEYDETHVVFFDGSICVTARPGVQLPWRHGGKLELEISCSPLDWQLSSLWQVCTSFFPPAFIPAMERLYICESECLPLHWQNDIESSQWLEVLQPFTAVKGLYICREFAPHIAPVLQELVAERAIEVLPAMETVFLEETLPSGPILEAFERFVAARQLDGRPVAVSRWEQYEHFPTRTLPPRRTRARTRSPIPPKTPKWAGRVRYRFFRLVQSVGVRNVGIRKRRAVALALDRKRRWTEKRDSIDVREKSRTRRVKAGSGHKELLQLKLFVELIK